jgi:hypothetical protein
MSTAGGQREAVMRSAASFGTLTPEGLRETFPQWRIFQLSSGVSWWATREGVQKWDGPESLLQRVIIAPDLTALAERLCLQEYLDGLSPEELAAVYRGVALPGSPG